MVDVLEETKNLMHGAIEHLRGELKGIRAGRASPSFVENIMVEVYGSPMRLKDVASISVPEPRQLLITPFDPQNAQVISKAIDKANLGVTVKLESKSVRVIFPELDANRRKELIGQCHIKREAAKVAIRNIRRTKNEEIAKEKKDGTLPEDEFNRQEKHIQELTDKYCKEADDVTAQKEKEIASI
jgi:ribosome recycling factor